MSPLELLLPAGQARRSLIIGQACPAPLIPHVQGGVADQAELIVLAPTGSEYANTSWLARSIRTINILLAADGVCYVLLPRRRRLALASQLIEHKLRIEFGLIHLPDIASSSLLVPLTETTLRYALSALVPTSRWKRWAVLQGVHTSGGRFVLYHLLASVGLVLRRPDARPVSSWLYELDATAGGAQAPIISTSWHGAVGTAVLHRFSSGDGVPSAVAKVSLTTQANGARIREAAATVRLVPQAERAGARAPRLRMVRQLGSHPVLLQTSVPGQAVAALLGQQPQDLRAVMGRIAAWLGEWNETTQVMQRMDRTRLYRDVLAPAELLAPLLKHGPAYYEWLMERCLEAEDMSLPLVATHNDLTVWNILLNGRGQLGIVDWESGRQSDFPLMDFSYAMTDAILAAHPSLTRLQAFSAGFVSGGLYTSTVDRLQTRYFRNFAKHDRSADLWLHCCWLRHAANEHHAVHPGDPRPFLQLLAALVQQTMRGAEEEPVHAR